MSVRWSIRTFTLGLLSARIAHGVESAITITFAHLPSSFALRVNLSESKPPGKVQVFVILAWKLDSFLYKRLFVNAPETNLDDFAAS